MSNASAARDPLPMAMPCGRGKSPGRAPLICVVVSWMACVPAAWPADMQNPTGLPLYPNLTAAVLDNVFRTDLLGHWCMHLSARSSDSLDSVENWYRRALAKDSETDLNHDPAYGSTPNLDGIKLSSNIDTVAIYRVAGSQATFIDLARCSAVR